MTQHIDGYDDMTVEEVKDAVRNGDFTTDEIRDILEYEEDHKDRVTITGWIEERYLPPAEDAEPETVTVTAGEYIGYVAGLHFDRQFEHKTVEYNTRIEQAIEDGDLRRVNNV